MRNFFDITTDDIISEQSTVIKKIDGFTWIQRIAKENDVSIAETVSCLHELAKIESDINTLSVASDQDLERARQMQSEIDQYYKNVEKDRVLLKKPFFEKAKKIDAFFSELKRVVNFLAGVISEKKKPFLLEKEKKRREEALRQEQKAMLLREEMEKKRRAELDRIKKEELQKAEHEGLSIEEAHTLATKKMSAIPKTPIIVAAVPPAIEDIKTVKKWRIIDIKLLPDACIAARLEHVTKAVAPWINAQQKAGNTEITGVEFYEEQTIK